LSILSIFIKLTVIIILIMIINTKIIIFNIMKLSKAIDNKLICDFIVLCIN